MSTDVCRSCGAAIVWATNDKTGKAAPIDATHDPTGSIVLLPGGMYRVLTKAERLDPTDRFEKHTNHWQRCPDRQAWKETYSRG